MLWTTLKKLVVPSTQRLRAGINHSIAGGKRGRFCRCSVCAVCCVCSVLRRLSLPSAPSCEMVQMVSAEIKCNRAMRPQRFIPTSQSLSLRWCLSPVPPASAKQGDSKQASKHARSQARRQAGKQSSKQASRQQASSKQAARGSKQQASSR